MFILHKDILMPGPEPVNPVRQREAVGSHTDGAMYAASMSREKSNRTISKAVRPVSEITALKNIQGVNTAQQAVFVGTGIKCLPLNSPVKNKHKW